jgi:acyl carrier protein
MRSTCFLQISLVENSSTRKFRETLDDDYDILMRDDVDLLNLAELVLVGGDRFCREGSMVKGTRDEVYLFLIDFLNRKLKEQRREPLRDLGDDHDIFLSGIIDSLGFAEFITAAGEHFGREIDLGEIDPEKMTMVGPLCAYVSDQFS